MVMIFWAYLLISLMSGAGQVSGIRESWKIGRIPCRHFQNNINKAGHSDNKMQLYCCNFTEIFTIKTTKTAYIVYKFIYWSENSNVFL